MALNCAKALDPRLREDDKKVQLRRFRIDASKNLILLKMRIDNGDH